MGIRRPRATSARAPSAKTAASPCSRTRPFVPAIPAPTTTRIWVPSSAATFQDVGEVQNAPANGVCQDGVVESCDGVLGQNIIVRYKTRNPNAFQLFGCMVSESNPGIT